MLSEVSLYVATPEQTIIVRKRNAAQWGMGLTVDEFLDREAKGDEEEFARDGKLITWVLAPRNDSTTLDFFCSCRTFKRKIVLCRPLQPGVEPVLEECYGYGVSSLFTPPEYRNKGYGKHTMTLLHWVLARDEYLATQEFPEAEWGQRPARVKGAGEGWLSGLWSDAGPTIYAKCGVSIGGKGWVVKDPISTVWKMDEVGDIIPEIEGEVTWLDNKLAEEVWNKDAEQIKDDVVQQARKVKKGQFSFLPNEGVGFYQWSRFEYHFSRYVERPPEYYGVQIGEGFATWTCEYRPGLPRTLVVTRVRADKKTAERLIQYALGYARRLGMDQVEAWNLGLGAEVVRDGHLPAVKTYFDEEVEWMANERFCWC
ncbi:hypothetical protein P691DRAFT_811379 [Macrolepiota fuliginosa MF-IS2]|uniref:LYC1 C-terminal domain-containing protein n=1 Tax=Macrolepiota fuliginosa MF-IS2 TaxID=1400762 RepID=A0A9P6C679_9AGAR|nr:hypothetical protein P691DRAFT_811379 [Macrolepiota fuliginosa MF-IS2]